MLKHHTANTGAKYSVLKRVLN